MLARLLTRLVAAAEHAEVLVRHRLRGLRGATTASTADRAGAVAPAGSATTASTVRAGVLTLGSTAPGVLVADGTGRPVPGHPARHCSAGEDQ
ncbi:hypothetical protein D5R93_02195 [Actinomyces lilanjuaniae]|uniref:Uncharacterized protein n=1 Tax=Actinomyces lilanjuaniae TaxID=2321394 RepID=A0ABN5PLS1_9ACTO|nr:hypothetical protein [Actinomyces lilanjuaniae]AYD89158.1 hypothetical protein D5R93_02195 [Actinomyces lilanjuaniae]